MSSSKDWFRSAEMEYISIVMQEHKAYSCTSRLGNMGVMQFSDLNIEQTAMNRQFVSEVQRCDAIERQIVFLETVMTKYNVKNEYLYDINTYLEKMEQRSKGNNESLLQELETLVNERAEAIAEMDSFRSNLLEELNYQIELQNVLEKSREFLSIRSDSSQNSSIKFNFLAGTIDFAEKTRMERMIFRSTRGNCLMRFSNIEYSSPVRTVFLIFYQAEAVGKKIERVCEAFSAKMFEVPDLANVVQFEKELTKVQNEIEDRRHVVEKNLFDIEGSLKAICKWIDIWKWTAAREKAIFHTMNYFSGEVKGVLRAEGWVIKSAREQVQQVVSQVHSETKTKTMSSVTAAGTTETPPTHFETNKFTGVFQALVDTYGVPRYREANPALLNVITFPFFFGVMFGDIGHGLLLLIFALFIIYKEEAISRMKLDEISSVVFSGRYFMALMGFFSIYCGLMYNDYFAMGLELFPTTYIINGTNFTAGQTVLYVPNPESSVYPVGIDPTWHHADNGLLFFNSVKMKMAVVFGVTQMTLGLFLKLSNAIYFKSKIDIFCEVIPQIIFLVGLFGYMCALIIIKWSLSWRPFCERDLNCEPPSIITTMIDMFLNIGTIEDSQKLYAGQETVQTYLLALVALSVPWMLIPKPFLLTRRHTNSAQDIEETERLLKTEEQASIANEEHHSATDIWIHQGIETIEFCLGGMSNTASYLRLWALSLAHSQLGSVFLENTLLNYITTEGFLGVLIVFGGYAAFAAITFGVLLVMDNLECFLHALRLHWVEFQSKFYAADGVAFAPLSFNRVLKEAESS